MISRPHNHAAPTGQETHMVMHCEKCGWRSNISRGMGMRPVCPQCSTYGMKFIKFDATELGRVNELLGKLAEPVVLGELENVE